MRFRLITSRKISFMQAELKNSNNTEYFLNLCACQHFLWQHIFSVECSAWKNSLALSKKGGTTVNYNESYRNRLTSDDCVWDILNYFWRELLCNACVEVFNLELLCEKEIKVEKGIFEWILLRELFVKHVTLLLRKLPNFYIKIKFKFCFKKSNAMTQLNSTSFSYDQHLFF